MAPSVSGLAPDRLIQLAQSLRAQADDLERLALSLTPSDSNRMEAH